MSFAPLAVFPIHGDAVTVLTVEHVDYVLYVYQRQLRGLAAKHLDYIDWRLPKGTSTT